MTRADRATYAIAERLGCSVGQVGEMTAAEFLGWLSLPKVDEEHERAENFERLKSAWLQ